MLPAAATTARAADSVTAEIAVVTEAPEVVEPEATTAVIAVCVKAAAWLGTAPYAALTTAASTEVAVLESEPAAPVAVATFVATAETA